MAKVSRGVLGKETQKKSFVLFFVGGNEGHV